MKTYKALLLSCAMLLANICQSFATSTDRLPVNNISAKPYFTKHVCDYLLSHPKVGMVTYLVQALKEPEEIAQALFDLKLLYDGFEHVIDDHFLAAHIWYWNDRDLKHNYASSVADLVRIITADRSMFHDEIIQIFNTRMSHYVIKNDPIHLKQLQYLTDAIKENPGSATEMFIADMIKKRAATLALSGLEENLSRMDAHSRSVLNDARLGRIRWNDPALQKNSVALTLLAYYVLDLASAGLLPADQYGDIQMVASLALGAIATGFVNMKFDFAHPIPNDQAYEDRSMLRRISLIEKMINEVKQANPELAATHTMTFDNTYGQASPTADRTIPLAIHLNFGSQRKNDKLAASPVKTLDDIAQVSSFNQVNAMQAFVFGESEIHYLTDLSETAAKRLLRVNSIHQPLISLSDDVISESNNTEKFRKFYQYIKREALGAIYDHTYYDESAGKIQERGKPEDPVTDQNKFTEKVIFSTKTIQEIKDRFYQDPDIQLNPLFMIMKRQIDQHITPALEVYTGKTCPTQVAMNEVRRVRANLRENLYPVFEEMIKEASGEHWNDYENFPAARRQYYASKIKHTVKWIYGE